jgi:hypothetical protein
MFDCTFVLRTVSSAVPLRVDLNRIDRGMAAMGEAGIDVVKRLLVRENASPLGFSKEAVTRVAPRVLPTVRQTRRARSGSALRPLSWRRAPPRRSDVLSHFPPMRTGIFFVSPEYSFEQPHQQMRPLASTICVECKWPGLATRGCACVPSTLPPVRHEADRFAGIRARRRGGLRLPLSLRQSIHGNMQRPQVTLRAQRQEPTKLSATVKPAS